MRRMLAATIAACSTIGIAHAQSGSRKVDLKAADGQVLKATYFSPGKPGPGIVLFHQCSDGATRHLWDPLAGDLVAAGFHVLTYDIRSFGETGGRMPPPPPGPPPPPPAQAPGAPPMPTPLGASPFPPGDADAAVAYLTSQKDVDAARIAAAGSSCGATDAAELATRRPGVKAIVLLSGLPTPGAVLHIGATPSLAVFGIYSDQDFGAASLRAVVERSKHAQSVLKMYPGSDHGVAIFTSHPELRGELVKWLRAQVR